MDYHRGLVELLKELRAARARNDGPAVEAAYAKLATHAESLEILVHFLHDSRGKWGANLEMDAVVTSLAGDYKSGMRRLYPMIWDHLSADPVFAEMERWLERASAPAGTTDAGEELRGLVLGDFDRQVFEEIAAKTTRVGIEYLAGRLRPGQRGAPNADPRTVRRSVDRLCDLGLVEDLGGRKAIAVTLKGKTYAALLDAERDTTAD